MTIPGLSTRPPAGPAAAPFLLTGAVSRKHFFLWEALFPRHV